MTDSPRANPPGCRAAWRARWAATRARRRPRTGAAVASMRTGWRELIARKMLGWFKRCKLAHAFLWEYIYKRLKLAQLLGQLGVYLTCAGPPSARRVRATASWFGRPGPRAQWMGSARSRFAQGASSCISPPAATSSRSMPS
jgi:hypothetical protein